jgi:hypothetical protein
LRIVSSESQLVLTLAIELSLRVVLINLRNQPLEYKPHRKFGDQQFVEMLCVETAVAIGPSRG